MATEVKAIPKGYHTITPNLVIRDAAKAIEFYKKAFGAEEIMSMPGPAGTVMHAELKIGDSVVMLGDEMPEMSSKSPKAYGGSPVSFYVYVDKVDAHRPPRGPVRPPLVARPAHQGCHAGGDKEGPGSLLQADAARLGARRRQRGGVWTSSGLAALPSLK